MKSFRVKKDGYETLEEIAELALDLDINEVT